MANCIFTAPFRQFKYPVDALRYLTFILLAFIIQNKEIIKFYLKKIVSLTHVLRPLI